MKVIINSFMLSKGNRAQEGFVSGIRCWEEARVKYCPGRARQWPLIESEAKYIVQQLIGIDGVTAANGINDLGVRQLMKIMSDQPFLMGYIEADLTIR